MIHCAGSKDSLYSLEQEPPFEITNSFFQRWVAGIKEGGSGVNVHITIENISEELDLKHIYFRNKKEKIAINVTTPDHIIANFKDHYNRKATMHLDPSKEAVNTPPEEFPFVLKDDEAVLSYLHQGEIKYVKISDMEERPLLAYPSTNPNGIE